MRKTATATKKVGMEVNAFNPIYWEGIGRRTSVQGQPRAKNKNKNKKTRKKERKKKNSKEAKAK
jgi:hypothetical protein